MKRLFLSVTVLVFFAVSLFSQSFETERTKQLYAALSENQKKEILKVLESTDAALVSADFYKNAQIKVKKNRVNEISFLGLDLLSDELIEAKYIDAYHFLESYVLALFLKKQDVFFFENQEISVQLAGKKISQNSEQVKAFIANLENCDFSFSYDKYRFVFTWKSPSNIELSFAFKADLNMLKGMNKVEFEQKFIRDLDGYKFSNETNNFISSNNRLHELPTGLYLLKGQAFGSDDFRSDVYFKHAGNSYIPVFSKKFPVESLSNLFLADNKNQLSIQTTLIQYAGRKELKVKDLNSINTFLKKDTKVYFGLAENKNGRMRATVLYYNDVYSYVHMLTVEADETIFDDQAKSGLKASLYIYIPRLDLIENIEKQKHLKH